jgi:hypothetical protein
MGGGNGMRIPINVGVKGRVTATLTNTETGEKKEVKGDNLILNHYLDWAMTQGLGILGTTTFDRCYIGTSNVPPQPTDTNFVGTQLAMSASSVLVKGLTPTDGQILEEVRIIENMGVSNENGLAITPDGKILVVASNGTDFPGLRAFLVNEDYSLTFLPVLDFEELENILCKNLAIGGDTLFVGLGVSPWGKVYKRVGNTFEFMSNVPSLGDTMGSSISADGSTLLVGLVGSSNQNARIYKINDTEIIRIPWVMSNSGNLDSVAISPSGNFGVVRSGSRLLNFKIEENEVIEYPFISADPSSGGGGVAWVSDTVFWANRYSSGTRRYFMYNILEQRQVINLSYDSSPDRRSLHIGGRFALTSNMEFFTLMAPTMYSRQKATQTLPADRVPRLSLAFYDDVMFVRLSNSNLGVYQLRDPILKQSYSRQWTFPAGVGTGIVNRIGLQANSNPGSGGNNRHVAQIVLPEPLEKTNLHQLDVIWEIEVENPGVWEGVILGGSRDGSDLFWQVTINEEQFFALVQTGYSIPANWFGVTGTPNVRIGTSNEESDLIFDRENIRGKQIQYISSTAISVVNPYVPGSLKRTIRLFLEVDQGNGQIGEIVLGGSASANSLARITFDPPLDKPPHEGEGANPYRIYFDLEIGWQRG